MARKAKPFHDEQLAKKTTAEMDTALTLRAYARADEWARSPEGTPYGAGPAQEFYREAVEP